MSDSISQQLIYRAGMARSPISGTFELSPMCNFSCKMCYIRRSPKEVAALGGLRSAEQWLALARDAREAGMLFLLLTGGEPFLYPNFLDLYRELASMGLVISVNTNGSLIDERAVAVLKSAMPKRLNITLYGASEESYAALCGDGGAFRRVMENVQRLRENGISYKFNFSVTNENCRELPQVIALGKEHGVPVDVAIYMFPPVRRGEGLPEKYRLSPQDAGYYSVLTKKLQMPPEKFRAYCAGMAQVQPPPEPDGKNLEMSCRAGRCSFWVSWKGNLSACGMMEEPGVSLLEMPFSEGWQRIVEETDRVRCLAGCSGCPNQRLCHPCVSCAYCETGDPNGRPEYKCKMLLAEAAACKQHIGNGMGGDSYE